MATKTLSHIISGLLREAKPQQTLNEPNWKTCKYVWAQTDIITTLATNLATPNYLILHTKHHQGLGWYLWILEVGFQFLIFFILSCFFWKKTLEKQIAQGNRNWEVGFFLKCSFNHDVPSCVPRKITVPQKPLPGAKKGSSTSNPKCTQSSSWWLFS